MKKIVEKASEEMAQKVERYIELHIRPKPWWLPDFLWKKLLGKLLILDEFIEFRFKKDSV